MVWAASGAVLVVWTAGTQVVTTTSGGPVSEYVSGNRYNYLADGLGSVVVLTNASGAVVDSYS